MVLRDVRCRLPGAPPVQEPCPMAYESISVTKLTPHIGAEIGNIDLTRPLSNRQVEELHQAFAENLVIFFRDQAIDHEAHKALARHFGELHIHVGPSTESKPLPDQPEIRALHFDESSEKVAGERWHTDQSCAPVPPLGSILHLHTVPPHGGGATLFASMYAAYEALSPQMQQYLGKLTATHDGRRAFGPNAPINVHPVVARHPVTGRKLLYINSGQTSHLNEVPREESDAILAFLYRHCADPEWQVRFQWRQHSIAFWDNRCSHHKAIWDYYPHVRSGFRIQIKGAAPPIAA
jgi:taurine dioxygenase